MSAATRSGQPNILTHFALSSNRASANASALIIAFAMVADSVGMLLPLSMKLPGITRRQAPRGLYPLRPSRPFMGPTRPPVEPPMVHMKNTPRPAPGRRFLTKRQTMGYVVKAAAGQASPSVPSAGRVVGSVSSIGRICTSRPWAWKTADMRETASEVLPVPEKKQNSIGPFSITLPLSCHEDGTYTSRA